MLAIAARITALALIASASVLAGAASAQPEGMGLGFTFVPRHVVQGEDARVSVAVNPTGSRCTLGVRYFGGSVQRGLNATTAIRGRATWTWHVPANIQAGVAKATVRCVRVGSISRTLLIVGRLVEPKIAVLKSGFSIKPMSRGTKLSYGLVLHNASQTKDANRVSVQVNFVMADNNLLGTDSVRVDSIAAGSDYALGHMMTFPGTAPIVRLEVVVQVESYLPHATHDPTLANIHLVPQIFEPQWLGSIEGELQNTDPAASLRSAQFSCVVFDSAGNVLGGGTGLAYEMLPPGTREFIKISSGLDPIPMEKAASAMVSMVSTWQAPAG